MTMNDRVEIRPVATNIEAQQARILLTQQIHAGIEAPMPTGPVHDDGTLRPTLIGAWQGNHLVGAALLGPAIQQARQMLASQGVNPDTYQAAQTILRHVAMGEAIAVHPAHRREGIGLKIKRFCDTWAADHDAHLVLSIVTNHAARALNEKAGHLVLEPHVALVLQVVDQFQRPLHPAWALLREQDQGLGLWALLPVTQPQDTPLRVGQYRNEPATGARHSQNETIEWITRGRDGTYTTRGETMTRLR